MKAEPCDHTSVGMLVWKNDKILLIERKKAPFGFAPPAGHVDGDATFEEAARRELREEVGLEVTGLTLLFEGKKDNPCRRENGDWHHWKVYQTEAVGDLTPNKEETKQAGWYGLTDIETLQERADRYETGEISPEEWQGSPGLELIWNDLLHKIGLTKY